MSAVCRHAPIWIPEVRSLRPAIVRHGITQTPFVRDFSSFVARILRVRKRAVFVFNTQGMIALGNRYLDAARRSGRPLSVAVFEFEHLQEVGGIFGDQIGHDLLTQVRARLAAAAGSHGAVAHTGPTQFTLLCPDSNRQAALDAIHRAMGTPARVEFESANDEIVLVPEFEIECAEDNGEPIQELYRQLSRELDEVLRSRQRHQAHLARERERRSRCQIAPRCSTLGALAA